MPVKLTSKESPPEAESQSFKQNLVFNREYSSAYEENLLPVDGRISYTVIYYLLRFYGTAR